jgi:hypothetical protein
VLCPRLMMLFQKLAQFTQARTFQKIGFLICFHWTVSFQWLNFGIKSNYDKVTAFCQVELTI